MSRPHRQSRSNEGFLLLDTVQTSWRPQMPLPKEIPMDNNSTVRLNGNSLKKDKQKWTLGGLFKRKKKNVESDSSSEDDRKAGFSPHRRKVKDKKKRSSKLIGAFDHIVTNPTDRFNDYNENHKPHEPCRSTGSLDRRLKRERVRASKVINQGSSSEEDLQSNSNTSSILRFRSDESLSGYPSKRTRSARTERYLKRLSRDEGSNTNIPLQVTQQVGRWKTQPLPPAAYYNGSTTSVCQPPVQRPYVGLQASSSLTNVPSVESSSHRQWTAPRYFKPHATVLDDMKSISYENYINQPRDLGFKSPPPPPPPRDPQRRLTVNNPMEPRPISYAFDRNGLQQPQSNSILNGRAVSDDHLWGPNHLIAAPVRPASVQPEQRGGRAMRRHNTEYLIQPNNGDNYKYVTDRTPRSRRPITISNENMTSSVPSQAYIPKEAIRTSRSGILSPMKTASNFWKRIDQEQQQRKSHFVDTADEVDSKGRIVKPRSMSSSRASDMTRKSMYDDYQRNNYYDFNRSMDEVDHTVVNGNLEIRPADNNVFEVTQPPQCAFVSGSSLFAKTNSMPNFYKKASPPPLNRYEEHVARNINPMTRSLNHQLSLTNIPNGQNRIPEPPRRSTSKRNSTNEDEFKPMVRHETNLEDAINELERIYKSLHLIDDVDLLDRAERRDIPTPTKFTGGPTNPDYDDEEENSGEPDIVLDDLVYRNIKHVNNTLKTADPQPPFGIPLGPIPTPPGTDYLHAPSKDTKKRISNKNEYPDVVADDLAFRNLRKDKKDPNVKQQPPVQYQMDSNKKKRAMKSLTANIYNLIQRDAAKPSGGNLDDYLNLDKPKETKKSKEVDDIPSTLWLIKSKDRDPIAGYQKQCTHRRALTTGGAVFNLPSTLKSSATVVPLATSKPFVTNTNAVSALKPPIPLPRSSSSPDPKERNKFEDALNAIAKEAKESSEKLTRELQELRKESAAQPNCSPKRSPRFRQKKFLESRKLYKSLEAEIDEVSHAARLCEDLLNESAALKSRKEQSRQSMQIEMPLPSRKIENQDKLINDIDDVAMSAKSYKTMMSHTLEQKQSPPKIVSEVPKVKDEIKLVKSPEIVSDEKSTIGNLLAQLQPEKNQIQKIADRCMKHLDELGNLQTEVVVARKNSLPNVMEVKNFFENKMKENESPKPKKQNFDRKVNGRSKTIALTTNTLTNTSNDGDYDNLSESVKTDFNKNVIESPKSDDKSSEDILQLILRPIHNQHRSERKETVEQEIARMMQECAEEAEKNNINLKTTELKLSPSSTSNNLESDGKSPTDESTDKLVFSSPTEEPFKSSSDCIKSSSVTPNRLKSSSITSIHGMSSSDYIKSPSSEFHAPGSECIKSNSTTSYDVKSSSDTANVNKSSSSQIQSSNGPSPLERTPSPPLALTPSGSEESQYNSAEELAMIFGTNQSSPSPGKSVVQNNVIELTTISSVPVRFSNPKMPHDNPTTYINEAEWNVRGLINNYLTTIHESQEEESMGDETLTKSIDDFKFINEITIRVDDFDAASNKMHFEPIDSSDSGNSGDSGNVSLTATPEESLPLVKDDESNHLNEVNNRLELSDDTNSSSGTVKDVDECDGFMVDESTVNQRHRTPCNANELPSTSATNGGCTSKSLTNTRHQPHRAILQPLLLACTLGMANNDLLTLAAVIIAIFTMFVLIMF